MRRFFVCLLAVWFTLSSLPVGAEEVSVSAASAVLIEATTGQVIFQKDAHTPRPMASTTKLMTALVAADCGDWSRPVQVTGPMVAVEGSALG
ncbi:MAG: D-alanyl-D-alanine carboxypeptidase, partial [Clostridia bacterium]|nr:D-alanyl-D-alanine carboxypeptidase [Clostridia bacterium]